MGNSVCLTDLGDNQANNNGNCQISYRGFGYPGHETSTVMTGIRSAVADPNNVLIGGFYTYGEHTHNGFVYNGLLNQTCGTIYDFNFPSSTNTRVWSVDTVLNNGALRVTGDYTTTQGGSQLFGMFFNGTLDGIGNWQTYNPQTLETSATVVNTTVINSIGDVVVGQYNTNISSIYKGFIYQTDTEDYYPISYPGSDNTVVTGVWYNWEAQQTNIPPYTLCGYYTNNDLSAGFLADWDFITQRALNWKSFYADNFKSTHTITQFTSIASDHNPFLIVGNQSVGYNVGAEWLDHNNNIGSSLVNVQRNANGNFATANWIDFSVPNTNYTAAISTNDNNYLVGYYSNDTVAQGGYIAEFTENCVFGYIEEGNFCSGSGFGSHGARYNINNTTTPYSGFVDGDSPA